MGLWDYFAPDYSTFVTKASPYIPDFLPVGGVVLAKSEVLTLAWTLAPSPAGILVRMLIDSGVAGAPQPAAVAGANGVNSLALAAPHQTINFGKVGAVAGVVIANCYRVAIKMVAGGHDIVNVIHVEGSASGQQAAAAAAVLAAWKGATHPLTVLSNLVGMVSITAMDLSSLSGGITVLADATLGSVSSTNALATRAASALIKLNGGTRSRSTRGRLYFGPIMEADIQSDGATLDTTRATGITNAFTAFLASLATANFPLVVASAKTSTATTVGSIAVEPIIATQRRRIR
jgi:hypothetical protein